MTVISEEIGGYIQGLLPASGIINGLITGFQSSSGIVNGYLYSSNIPIGGIANKSINGYLLASNANFLEIINAFMDTDEGQIVVNAVMNGILDITNQSFNGFMPVFPIDNATQIINGLIFNPLDPINSQINAFMNVPDVTISIGGGINLGQQISVESIGGFTFGLDPNAIINALIFRPPAENNSINAFVQGFDINNQQILAFITPPSSGVNQQINGFLNGFDISTETINGFELGILGTASGNIGGYVSGILGAPNEQIVGIMPAASGLLSEIINGVISVLDISNNSIIGLVTGWPSGLGGGPC